MSIATQVSKISRRDNERENLTSAKQCPLAPIHRQQNASPETHALRKVDAAPQVHGEQATAKVQAVEVEDGCVADVRQGAHVRVRERLVH